MIYSNPNYQNALYRAREQRQFFLEATVVTILMTAAVITYFML